MGFGARMHAHLILNCDHDYPVLAHIYVDTGLGCTFASADSTTMVPGAQSRVKFFQAFDRRSVSHCRTC